MHRMCASPGRRGVGIFFLTGIVGMVGAAPAFAGRVVSAPVGAAAQHAAIAHWTAARMRAAKPIHAKPAAGALQPAVTGDTATGRPGLAGGARPGGLRSSSARVAAAGTFPGPNQTWPLFTAYLRYPMSTVGKFFFTQDGTDHVCSGAVTYGGNANQLDTVWTAGRCVADGAGSFDSSGLFCPSYNTGGVHRRVGCWSATSFGTSAEWFNDADPSRDYGVIFTDPSGGKA